MSKPNVVTLRQAVLVRAAARTNGTVSPVRLRQILRGSPPLGEERFVFWPVLVEGPIGERRQLAAAANLPWAKFAARFQALTGIHRDRASYAKTLYARLDEGWPDF